MKTREFVCAAIYLIACSLTALAKPEIIPASSLEQLAAKENEAVIVEGVVRSSTISDSGRLFLNFSDPFYEGFTAMVPAKFTEALGKDYLTGDLNGKKVRIHGTIELYKKRPRIVIETANQLEVVEQE